MEAIIDRTAFGLDWNAAQGRCAIPLTGDRLGFYTFERPACLELIGHTGEGLRPGAFSPDGSLLAIPDSQSLCVWNLRSGNLCARLTHSVPCEPFFSPDGPSPRGALR